MSALSTDPVIVNDPFFDDEFAGLSLQNEDGNRLERLTEIANEDPEFAPQPPQPLPAIAPPDDDVPEIVEYEDGSSVQIEHTNKGWKATLNSGIQGRNPEVFKGQTKNEMWMQLAEAKVNATRKIVDLNRKVKLGMAETVPSSPRATTFAAAPAGGPHQFTADEIFELKTQLQVNPAAAFEKYLSAYGVTPSQLTALVENSQRGAEAYEAQDIESIARGFLAERSGYYADPTSQNLFSLVAWISKTKLRKALHPGEDIEQAIARAYRAGAWTVDNLAEAYDDLLEAEVLVELPSDSSAAPVAPSPEPVVSPPSAPPIAVTRRPRAGLGVRVRDTASAVVPTSTDRPPTVEDLESLSSEEINRIMSTIRQQRAQGRR